MARRRPAAQPDFAVIPRAPTRSRGEVAYSLPPLTRWSPGPGNREVPTMPP